MGQNAHYTSAALTRELADLRDKLGVLVDANEYLLELVDNADLGLGSIKSLSESRTMVAVRLALRQAKAVIK